MAIIAGVTTDGNDTRSYKGRKERYERLCNAVLKEADKLGRPLSDARCATFTYRDKDETRDELLMPFKKAHGDEPVLAVYVDVSGSAPDDIHIRAPHIHAFTIIPRRRLRDIHIAAAARNQQVPNSYQIRPPTEAKDGKGGIAGWQSYCAGRDNLRHQGSETFADRLTTKRAALWRTQLERKSPGNARVSGQPLACARVGADSAPCSEANEPAKDRTPTIATVAAQHRAEGRDATNTDHQHGQAAQQIGQVVTVGFDPETGEVFEAGAVVISRDLFGANTIPLAPLDSYHGGTIPEPMRAAVRLKLHELGMTQDDLATIIGKSRCHLTNALVGRFPLGHEAAERLASWLRNPEPPFPQTRQKVSKARKVRYVQDTGPSLFDMVA